MVRRTSRSRWRCRPARSSSASLFLVVVFGIVIDGVEEFDDLSLLAVLDVLLQRLGHRRFLSAVAADFLRFLQQEIVDSEIRSHI